VRQRVGSTTGSGQRAALRWAGRLTGIAVATLVGLGVAPGVASARPHDPTDGEIGAAQQAAQDAATQVGQISAQLAAAQAKVDAAHAAANIALDDFQGKQAEYEQARTEAKAAAATARKARTDLAAARNDVAAFARDSYVSGSTSSRLTGLLTSGSPTQMLERAALLDAAGDHRSGVLTRVTVVEERARQADDSAKAALAQADTLKKQAADALASAEQLEVGARQQAAAFEAQQQQMQAQLGQAQQTLANLRA
jgi:peptidoglycan DL-endopeptidase RipA